MAETKNIHDKINRFCIMDDKFMKVFFEGDKEVVQMVLRTILSMLSLVVTSLEVPKKVTNLHDRSLQFDIIAEDEHGKIYNIEIQKDDRGAHPKRARYHSSILDANYSNEGNAFDNLPDKIVIFITENDYFERGEEYYEFRCQGVKGDVQFEDGEVIVYVNGENDRDTVLGRLMKDFKESDPAKMSNMMLAEKMKKINGDDEIREENAVETA